MGSLRYANLLATLVEREQNQNGGNSNIDDNNSPRSPSITTWLGAVVGIVLLIVGTMMYCLALLSHLRSKRLIQQQYRCLL
jgi:H+/Cl- antiporter ClcA